MKKRIIFHIDANSAYLSWEAVWRLQHGYCIDLREIPSAVGGDPKTRHGIILAKSIPSREYGITTGESLYSAKQKCPHLYIAPPNYSLYMKCSDGMVSLLNRYSSLVQRYSVDECFLDYTDSEPLFGDALSTAAIIKDKIKSELGFTVNIGVAHNKLLAKMASELQKPDQLHTLFPGEIETKMWTLPVEELFMVGRRTLPKLKKIGIDTIGDLARSDPIHIKSYLKSYGLLIWNYANGIDNSVVIQEDVLQKGVGNSTTLHYDVTNVKEAHMVLLSLTEMVCMRLREKEALAGVVSISIKNFGFSTYSHQYKMLSPIDCTNTIFDHVKRLFDEVWKGDPIRHMGVRLTELCSNKFYQTSIFDMQRSERYRKMDKAMDVIRKRYGKTSLIRSVFLHSGLKPIIGGVGEDEYPMMASIL
ncbi:MAG: DNA polymerase Y family protein [Eubacteriales bacterium]